jgi:hypothetical protein
VNASDILWVPDTSTFIALKKTILPRDQEWAAFRALEEMAVDGDLALERHVIRELTEYAYSDVPAAWAHAVLDRCKHPLDADLDLLREVMAVAGDIVEKKKEADCADPYVLTLASQLKRAGHSVRVVTDDVVDRPPLKMSMRWAASNLAWRPVQRPSSHSGSASYEISRRGLEP